MRTLSRFALLPLAITVLGMAVAIAAPPSQTPKADVPPPPGINDPGVTAAPAQQAQPAADGSAPANADPLAPLPKPDTRLVRDRVDRDRDAMQRRMANSEHETRQQGDDTVDEYRQNAEECRQLAKQALTRNERDQLLELAAIWERLANDRLMSLPVRPDPVPAEPKKE